jgi:hypothetical protein
MGKNPAVAEKWMRDFASPGLVGADVENRAKRPAGNA